jgi:hypothetical protein
MVGKKRVWVDDIDRAEGAQQLGFLMPQKTVQPVSPQWAVAPAAPTGMSWEQFSGKKLSPVGFTPEQFASGGIQRSLDDLAKTIGFSGPAYAKKTFEQTTEGEYGPQTRQFDGFGITPEFLNTVQGLRFTTANRKDGRSDVGIYRQDGSFAGTYAHGDKDSKLDKFMEKAIPLGVGLLGGAAFGGFIPGAEIGAAGAAGGGGAAAAAGAADIGALGLSQGVYGAGGALGAGAVPGTVGGLAGSTAAFGGLGSVLPAGVGFAAPAALGAGAAFDLATVGGPDPAGLVPSTPQPVEFGGQGLLGEPTFTPSLSGGLEPFVQQLPTIGAEATAFGGLPELSALAAGAPAATPFGAFGGGLLAAPTSAAPVFNAAADSQLASSQLGITGAQSAAAATAPATINLGSLGGTMGTAGGLTGLLQTGQQVAGDALGAAKGLLGPAGQWLKDNPQLGRLLLGGATSLLSGAGGGSSGAAPAPSGPPVQWNSGLQQGLLAPVQQYAPAAVQQNRPAGLLAQGFANDGAWRYLGG